MHSRTIPAATSLSFLLAAVLLSGCGMGLQDGGSVAGAAVTGHIIGGQQPVSNATIQLYAASSAGYGAASTALVSSTVLSDLNGGFTLTNLYTCPSATAQVYLVATGGNPSLSGVPGVSVHNNARPAAGPSFYNSNLAMIAALGDCGSLSGSTNIIINEVTTVAAVWALAPFMTAYDHVGTSSGNAVGLRNAFGMAANLASFARGTSPGDVPAGASIPAAEVNTLGNILSACVNTYGGTDGDGSACGNLFHDTKINGIVPTDTVGAALLIALNPAHNADLIYGLSPSFAPFQPALGSQPNDWTVAVNFSIGNRTTSGIAFDATGNLWVVSPDALYELNPKGAVLGSYPAMAGNSVAIDATGNIWVTTASNTLAKMPSTLSAPAVYAAPNAPNVGVDGLAIDGTGKAWYTCDTCTAIYRVDASGNYLGATSVAGSVHQTNVSVDTNENVWLGNFDYAQINVFANTGTALPGSPLGCGTCGFASFVANDAAGRAWIVGSNLTRLATDGSFVNYESPTGGLRNPAAVAIDGAGNAWVANTVGISNTSAGSLSEFTNAGTVVSPALGYESDSLATPLSVAVDGSGNVWLRNTGNATVTAFVGAGVPVVTPLALGVKNNTLGSKP
jgi:hypothetical protein